MSRVAKSPINIPDNVEFSINENIVKVKGNKGELEFTLPVSVSIEVQESVINVKFDEANQQSLSLIHI